MKMFNKQDIDQRIGDMPKSKTLEHLRPVEKYFLKEVGKIGLEQDYDVVANELPWFRTISYTEFAHCFIMAPLAPILRDRQIVEAYNDVGTIGLDYIKYFKDRITSNTSNKYSHLKDTKISPRDHLIVPVGSNKIKETVCMNKILYIIKTHGEDEVYLKPHPLTTHQVVGELRDQVGEDVVLDRNIDLYRLMVDAEVVWTSHRSESIVYAISLGKEIGCIDTYHNAHQGSFYYISNGIFESGPRVEDQQKFIQRTFNSYKSGVINPELDDNWKNRIDNYLEYIMNMREEYRYKYVWNAKGTMEKSK